ncbi:hypothetical protein DFQ28_004095 [Apophysomyces sp. BC1034]|nr:hypothetical protein DFQ30_001348 [Apophysomyces sp. BC1015]KAG0182452.1 hypothetical protein DFQ29_004074 [Apophysomyces sp. BC1021]KAG0193654.1 hypothetical protein DFQ28_004095 [Apophysomyces sp. BC1034]
MAESPKENEITSSVDASETPKEILIVDSESRLGSSEEIATTTSESTETHEILIINPIPTAEPPKGDAIVVSAPAVECSAVDPTITAFPTAGSPKAEPVAPSTPSEETFTGESVGAPAPSEETLGEESDVAPMSTLENTTDVSMVTSEPVVESTKGESAEITVHATEVLNKEPVTVSTPVAEPLKKNVPQKYQDFHQFIIKTRETQNMLPTMKRSLEDAAALEEVDKRIQKRQKARKSAIPIVTDLSFDRGKFYERLKTFPPSFAETRHPIATPELVMHGWQFVENKSIQDKEISCLTCNECQSTMAMISLEPYKSDNTAVSKVIKRYEDGLFRYHNEQCFWKLYHCKDQIYSFPLRKSGETIERIETEGRRFLASGPELPAIHHHMTDDQLREVRYLVSSLEDLIKELETAEPTETMMTAYTLAIFGWCFAGAGSVQALKCQDCFSTTGFHQIKPSGDGESEEDAFDIVTRHREYCPWRNKDYALVTDPNRPDEKDTLISGIEWVLAMVEAETKSRRSMYEELLGFQESREQQRRETNRALEAEVQEVLDRVPSE